jgi:diaminopimelate epimerase
MQLHFQKMQGAGNKIVVVDQRSGGHTKPDEHVLQVLREALSEERFDQLMWLEPAQDSASVASYRVFNYDGSEVEQCGNGVRCVAVLLATQDPRLHEFSLESPAGVVEARINSEKSASVNMGTPSFDDAFSQLQVGGQLIDVDIVSMGNPHCVLDVPDVRKADVNDLGATIEGHERFPDRINVGFMHIVDRNNIDLRVFERGVGETAACGTGACAAAASGIRRGLLDNEVIVSLPGGQLVVSWRGGNASCWLSGEVTFISEETVDL